MTRRKTKPGPTHDVHLIEAPPSEAKTEQLSTEAAHALDLIAANERAATAEQRAATAELALIRERREHIVARLSMHYGATGQRVEAIDVTAGTVTVRPIEEPDAP